MSTGKLTQNQVLDEHVEELQNLENQDYADEVYQEVMEEVRDEIRVEELMEDTEDLNDDSLTNDLRYNPEEDLIIKKYNTTWESIKEKSFTPFFAYGGNVLKAKLFDFPTLASRMNNEVDIKDEIKDLENVNVPDVELRVNDTIVYEMLDAENLKNYLPENPDEAYEVGKLAGEGMKEMRSNGIQQTDARPVNIMVDDSDDELQLYLVDQEYSNVKGDGGLLSKVMRKLNPLRLIIRDERGLIDIDAFTYQSGARHLDPEIYSEMKKGFEEGLGEEFRKRNDIPNNLVSPIHAYFLEKNQEYLENSKENTFLDKIPDNLI
jgi:hypothetical protein